MSKRKYKPEVFQARRIQGQWWVFKKNSGDLRFQAVEAVATQRLANLYADDYTEQYFMDLYIQQQRQDQAVAMSST